MRVFLAGATGVVGRFLVPQLVAEGHEVVGTTRSADKAARLRDVGAEGVVLDLLDRNAARAAVTAAKPEAIIHQATALSKLTARSMRKFDQAFAVTNQLRIAGTDNLLAAAREAGTARFVAQSFAPLIYARTGTSLKTEADALDQHPAGNARETMDAIHRLETAVLAAHGIDAVVLRYGGFYGPGTSMGAGGEQIEAVRKRQFPIVGDGGGVLSFIHVEDAASAAVAALHGPPGVYNIVDDDPAPARDVAMHIAMLVGAKPPRRVPKWLARMLAGENAVVLMTEARGSSNAKARRELGWVPRYSSWRDGLKAELA
jgi:2-alkyl-3-oxoalkanoate reductase